MLKIGIIGLPSSGKTTLYQTLKRDNPDTHGKNGESITITPIEDSKLGQLANIYNPKKITKTKIELSDGLPSSSSSINTREATRLRNLNCFFAVLDSFSIEKKTNMMKHLGQDINAIIEELCLQDLPIVESSIEKISKESRKGVNARAQELETLKKISEDLNLSKLPGISETEKNFVKGYQFLSLKPIHFIANIDENNINSKEFTKINTALKEKWPFLSLEYACLELEKDLQDLEEDERGVFLEEYNLNQPASEAFLKKIFMITGRHFFYTGGPTEVRAWDIPVNSTIQEAAGAIHKDLEKNFIKGDVWPSDKVIEFGSESNAKKEGFWSLQGKDYIVKNGDLVLIRHSG
ncbi:redox-regulated ATPase YchF [bacterium]|nr:redox-regulated ATPase YchF [bacterium]